MWPVAGGLAFVDDFGSAVMIWMEVSLKLGKGNGHWL
jgi:hypothetical protein